MRNPFSYFKSGWRNLWYVRNPNRSIRFKNGSVLRNPSRIQWHNARRGKKGYRPYWDR